MKLNTRSGGLAEQALRSAVWRRGLRFRKQPQNIGGKPDLVLTRHRVCVFCDGDFWHGRNWKALGPQLERRANGAYWRAKIEANRARDRRISRELRRAGWTVVRLWETDVLRDPEAAADRVEAATRRTRNM